MSTSTAINFETTTERICCGRGTLLLVHDDDVFVSAYIVVGHNRTRISRAAARALQILLAHLGEVVRYDEFDAPKDSVRRDLKSMREVLEECGLEIEAIRYVGYRLRSTNAKIPTRIIGDLALDIDGCRLIRNGRTKIIGPTTASVLLVLSDGLSMTAERIYRTAWNAEPFAVEACVESRVRDLRGALVEIGSKIKIAYEYGRYLLRLPRVAPMPKPKKEIVDNGFVQMEIPFPVVQESLFTILSAGWAVSQRRERRPRPDWRAIYEAMEPLFPIEAFA